MSDSAETYQEQQERINTELAGQTKEEVIAATGGIDLDNLPTVTHQWVERGAVVSCEGAGHPNHRHFLVKRRR